jgi:hypothetical protein
VDGISGQPGRRVPCDREARDDSCGPIPAGIKLVLAWWDRAAECGRAGIMVSDTTLAPGIKPFSLRLVRTMFSPPLTDDPWPGNSFDPRRDAASLAERQRLEVDERGIERVGGAFDAYRAHAQGIERYTVTEWSDAIGKPIR